MAHGEVHLQLSSQRLLAGGCRYFVFIVECRWKDGEVPGTSTVSIYGYGVRRMYFQPQPPQDSRDGAVRG